MNCVANWLNSRGNELHHSYYGCDKQNDASKNHCYWPIAIFSCTAYQFNSVIKQNHRGNYADASADDICTSVNLL